MIRSKRKRRSRDGYLLVTVIVMIAVASLMLSRMASTSMRVASAAIEEEKDLRNRWAVTSLRRFSLDNAHKILGGKSRATAASGDGAVAKPFLWKNARLGGQTWRVIIGDESAKLNLVHASRSLGKEAATRIMDELAMDGGLLKPSSDTLSADQSGATRWEHWLLETSGAPASSPRHMAVATQRMTLWGSGRVNVLSSERETLDVLWHQLFGRGLPPAFDSMRTQSLYSSKEQLIRSLALRESQARLAEEWLDIESDCFSVWIFCESDRRVPSSLYVDWGDSQAAQEHRGHEY
ncbi:hypothetical protein K227x_58530 [Rubripirellula lacrimiformis]|uniref:General secretion pathway protein K n=1 Tax=Rubripirellula lacrimiformis TaxID=1930273 RepID=A0A517NJX0_9BACT|nr:hypothetical protein [Rubripirellula lacrimiformis]QDT07426.1 hypothetical protein K227x_58530 [Rubripirellula lacrimiformis]